MHVAILLAGHSNNAMPERFHDYHYIFTTLFSGLPFGEIFCLTSLAVVDDDVFPDQVTSLPKGARLIGTTNHYKTAAYIIDDLVFAIQGQPEFDVAYTSTLADLLEKNANTLCIQAAHKSFSIPHNGKKVVSWILSFFSNISLVTDGANALCNYDIS
ncbi:hypothetical protein N8500_03255 [Candidatus Puniceispirillum sp.]|nr:hypothetical protein [Candidatus Puniceispirillum sp.]